MPLVSGQRSPVAGPSSPARSRRFEEYGDSMRMDDSPRHSYDSNVSLLHGHHSRSNSQGSLLSDAGIVGERGSHLATPTGLATLNEDVDVEAGLYEHDDELTGSASSRSVVTGRKTIPDDSRRGSLHDKILNNSSNRSGRRRTISDAIPPPIRAVTSKFSNFVSNNRGILMICLSQACFASMNATVSYSWQSCRHSWIFANLSS